MRREIFIPSEFKIFSSFESDKDFSLDCSIYFWIFDFITVEEICLFSFVKSPDAKK